MWAAIAVAGFLGYQRLDDVTAIGQSSFLPAHAQSTRAITELNQPSESAPPPRSGAPAAAPAKRSSEGDDLPALIAFARDGGLTQQDRALIGRIGRQVRTAGLRGSTPTIDPLTQSGSANALGDAGLVSDDGEAAFIALGIDAGERGAVTHDVNKVRRLLRQEVRLPGLQAHVTGPAGVAVDLEEEAADAGKTLVYVTAALVLLLLLAVYRAPLLALVPLVVVGVAYMAACGLAYVLIKSGEIDVSSEGTLLLLVLIFGAGTDYSLLLVHRYREELAGGGVDDAEAVARALRATGPSILASGGTVIAAMLCLLLADLESTRWLGPILALGVATMLAAAFTLLPAVLSLLGSRAFWPARARATPDTQAWERLAAVVRRRARVLVAAIFAALALLALGNLVSHQTLGFGQDLPASADSTKGTKIFNEHFTPGLTSPLPVVVPTDSATRALVALEGVPGVAFAVPAPTQGDRSLLIVVLESDPYTRTAMDVVEAMRSDVKKAAPGAAVGGVPAENVDIENTNDRDTRLIIPVVLLVVFLILCVSLRALVAPLYLIVTVVASFFATLGLATLLFIGVLDQPGLTYNLVLLAFIFLVALGVDYNIFLMGRAREEAAEHGTREGMRRALVTTGSVVTGAGVILAGTFATLTLLPLLELVQIGGTVAIGVVLDTFVVRALLVPSITELAGDRAWWPRRLSRPGSG